MMSTIIPVNTKTEDEYEDKGYIKIVDNTIFFSTLYYKIFLRYKI